MVKKKLISRVLVFMLALILTLTCLPPNLIASALGGIGGGQSPGGSGGGGSGDNNSLLNHEIGLRFSLVTLKRDPSTGKLADKAVVVETDIPGKYFIDAWVEGTNLTTTYASVVPNTRYATESGEAVTPNNILYGTTVGTIDTAGINDFVNNRYIAKYGANASAAFNMGSVLKDGQSSLAAVFNEWDAGAHYGFDVNGELFYTWAMDDTSVKVKNSEGEFEGVPNMEAFINTFYSKKLGSLDLSHTFLTVEPIILYADIDGTTEAKYGGWNTRGKNRVSSLYGYIARQQYEGWIDGVFKKSYDPGRAWVSHGRLAQVANGFCFVTTSDAKMLANVLKVLKLRPATEADEFPEGSSYFYFGNKLDSVGLGIQAFWLKDLDIDDTSPIDTYDIINQDPNIPTPPEEPYDPDSSTDSDSSDTDTADTSGTKSIIKVYADLYKDDTTGLYTHIENIKSGDPNHPYAFAQTDVSNEITITNEEPINGYRVSAWYISKTAYDATNKTNNAMLKATNMINVADLSGNKTDGTVSLTNLGGKQLRINNYQAAYKSSGKAGYNSYEGCQKFLASLPDKHGPTGTGTTAISFMNAKQYYTYKRLETKGTSNYGTYNYPVTENDDVVTLGEEDQTIVILYTRERTYISTSDLTTDETIPDTPDDREDKSGNLTIVKLFGVINPNTYEITADPSKSSVVTKNTTRNVNINNESGYSFAQWIYITGGAPTNLSASQMGNPNLGTFKLDTTADQAYRLDGFVDNFKNNSGLEQYFRFSNNGTLQLPTINIISTDDVSSSITPGRYSYGSRSGIGTGSYNSTLYLGGDKLADNTPDDTDQNDVLYLLFLKTDQLSYSADDLVIPESYISRYDNYKHNPMTVKGTVSNTSYEEYLQAHKFKYVLPVVTGTEYVDVNPLFIPHIALTNKTQAGLITDASSVQRLQLNENLTHEVIKAYTNPNHTGLSDYAQLLYIDQGNVITSSASSGKKYVGNMLNVNALNLEYTAYRNGDKVTPAIWKYNKLNTLTSSTSPLSITDTKKPLADIAVSNINAAISPLTNSGAVSSSQSSRQPNDSAQNFKLNFTFSEVGDGIKSIYLTSNKACRIYTITDLHGVDQPRTITINNTTLNLFKSNGAYGFSAYSYKDNGTKILAKAECAELPLQFSDYAIHSLNRLYQIKQSDGTWKYATGVTRYLNTVSDVSITQNVQYSVHYGSPKTNPYTDKTESGSGTDTTRGQFGYVRSMSANNTITFYPYHVMQYEIPESYNATLNKDGTLKSDLEIKSQSLGNNANQLYISGEEARSLNVYDYAEVSYYGHAVSSSKGVDVVNNVLNTNRKGRIEISSEQWSTHARASSLIGLNNCALPGGATLSITIPAANRQTVTITSYSSLLPTESAGYSQVQAYANTNGKDAAFGDMPTDVSDATTRHNMLVESVAAGFEGLNVEQFFSDSDYDFSNTKNNGETYDAANTVYEQIKGEIPSGDNLYSVKSSKVYSVTDFTGKEDKYYYRPDGDVSFDAKGSANAIDIGKYSLASGNNKDGNGNTGDFDTNYEDKLNTSTVTYYTFYMNRVGQVLCIKSNTTAASAKANLTGTAAGDGAVVVANWSSTDPNGFTYASGLASDIKLAAQNTGIVEQLYKQLEEGTGKDSATPWSKNNPNGEWYFEAFDGLSDRLMKII